ncbi:MAG: hypothetical protein VB042_04345 [Victivallaceae bacterium]|nr:hypothetical protein [Victivallaceae bacterium]
MGLWDVLTMGPVGGLFDSFAKHVLFAPVTPVRGSVVRCDLDFGRFDHTGLYVGNNRIVELGSDGKVKLVTPEEFLNSTPARTGISVYVACDESTEVPLGSRKVAKRALRMLGRSTHYHPALNNCHEFVSGFLTGEFDNCDNMLWMLEQTIADRLNHGDDICWRVWG